MTPARIHAVGGLCNRLQAILSHRAVYGEVVVRWDADAGVSHAHFLDVFEPMPGVRFDAGIHREAWSVHPEAPPLWDSAYAELVPVESAATRIRALRGLMGEYLAVHIRRTDHVPLVARDGQQLTTDADFLSWIADRWQLAPMPVFVATDNGVTQRRMLHELGERAVFSASHGGDEVLGIEDRTRQGTLADAVVDLYVCAGAREFMGSHYSSFSATIERLRNVLPLDMRVP